MRTQPQVLDEIIVDSHETGQPRRRHGVVLDVLGETETPYFRVRWEDGHESTFFPGTSSYTFVAHAG